jgi:hypothetical protein
MRAANNTITVAVTICLTLRFFFEALFCGLLCDVGRGWDFEGEATFAFEADLYEVR